MQQNQVFTYGIEGVLAERLRELAQAQRFRLRETSQLSACRNLLQSASPRVLVLRLGNQLEQELALLEQVHACLPKTAVIAVGEADNPVLAGLVWELGATFALFPPTPVEMIADVIVGLLREGPA
jgi:DNA-binding NarL/FixJ family response regulator